MTHFDERARVAMRLSLKPTGMEDHRAAQAVDLACDAADRAADLLFETARRAGDPSVGLSVVQIGSQLMQHMMVILSDRALAEAQGYGLRTARVRVAL